MQYSINLITKISLLSEKITVSHIQLQYYFCCLRIESALLLWRAFFSDLAYCWSGPRFIYKILTKTNLFLGARFDDGAGGDNEVQRTMLELINQLDGFDPRGNIKVLMATNRPDTLDPALMRPGRLDRKIEFGLPDLEVCNHHFMSLLHDLWLCKMVPTKINPK